MVSVVASITSTQLAWHGAQYSSRPPAAAQIPAHLYTPIPSAPNEAVQSMRRTDSVSASITSTHGADEGAQNSFLPPSAAAMPSNFPPPSTPQGTLLHISVLPSIMSTSGALYGAQNSLPRAIQIPAHFASPRTEDHAMVRAARGPAWPVSITSTSSAEDGAQNSLSSYAAIPTYLPEPRTPQEILRTDATGLVEQPAADADADADADVEAEAKAGAEAAAEELPKPNQAAICRAQVPRVQLRKSGAAVSRSYLLEERTKDASTLSASELIRTVATEGPT